MKKVIKPKKSVKPMKPAKNKDGMSHVPDKRIKDHEKSKRKHNPY